MRGGRNDIRGGCRWINQDFRRNNVVVSDVLCAMGKEVVDFLVHPRNLDVFVGLARTVWMHDDQAHAGDAFSILVLQDFAINVQLQAVMVEIRIG